LRHLTAQLKKIFLRKDEVYFMQVGMGKSHAKIILIGDHSVVYGFPAICLPLKAVPCVVTIKPQVSGQPDWLTTSFFTGPVATAPRSLHGPLALWRDLADRLAITVPLAITIDSQVPTARGMGSSAATAIALTRAFYDYAAVPLSDALLQRWAAVSEDIIHGTPSGIDAATTASAVPLWFVKNAPIVPLTDPLRGVLVIADSGKQGETGPAVAAVRELRQTQPQATNTALTELGDIAEQGRRVIHTGDLETLGSLLNQDQSLLQQLTVSDPALDHLIAVARQAGALGAKLTGGGRGGCMIALCPDLATAGRVNKALQDAHASATWIDPLDTEENNHD
jgi:mevalonate kinase